MDPTTQADFSWLVSPAAEAVLRQAQEDFMAAANPVSIAKSLRKVTTVPRSAMVMEQAQLRIRAKIKFADADRMFFTRRGLEQSTAEDIAAYKAKKFAGLASVADVCCGIGGDLMQLAGRCGAVQTIGIDQDPLTCLFARHNATLVENSNTASSLSIEIIESPFSPDALQSFDGIHCDPDRRMENRTVVGANFSPPLGDVLTQISGDKNLAVKVAPATQLDPSEKTDGADLESIQQEWIGDRRECKQLIIWRGPDVARAGFRTATCVDGEAIHQLSVPDAELDQTIEAVNQMRQYLFEPHPSVIAAKLVDVLANRRRIYRMAIGVDYLTAAEPDSHPLLSQFEVLEAFPLDFKKTVKALKARDVGQVELKKRGVNKSVFEQFEKMKLKGSAQATVILTRIGRQHVVAIAKRV